MNRGLTVFALLVGGIVWALVCFWLTIAFIQWAVAR